MHKKNLISQVTQPINRSTIQELPTQFIELSDKDLQHIVGGSEPASAGSGNRRDT